MPAPLLVRHAVAGDRHRLPVGRLSPELAAARLAWCGGLIGSSRITGPTPALSLPNYVAKWL
jgi:hypothetical protein